MKTTNLAAGLYTPRTTRIAQGAKDKGLLLGSTTYLIGSTEGFIGNRLPVAT
jgi:hypothetical protein